MHHDILDNLLASKTTSVCWLGNLSWLIAANGKLVAFDLDLDRDYRLNPSPIPTEAIAAHLDIQFITHEHEDHFSSITSKILADQSNCLFIIPANCVDKAKSLGIPDSRIHVAIPDEPFDLNDIKITPFHALHGHRQTAIYKHANFQDCGYHLTVDKHTFFQPGDSVLLEQHMEISNLDVLFVSPTIHNTHIDQSKILIEIINPRYIFPQHYGTYQQTQSNFFWTKGYPDELYACLNAEHQSRFHKLSQGQITAIE